MAELVTLRADGPLGAAGTQVWVNDPADVEKAPPRKSQAQSKKSDGK